VGSAWLAWSASQEHRSNDRHGVSLWLLTPQDSARILSIDTQDDIDRLFDAYSLPLRAPRTPGALGLNWPRLALDFDALHLTKAGFVAGWPLFSTWSCESTIWFRDCFREQRKLAELTWHEAFESSRAHAILDNAPDLDLP
jgi:hypothetical protein